MKKIFSILLIFIWFCCVNVACDPSYGSIFFVKNSLSEPITYITNSGNKQDTILINPNQSRLITEIWDMDSDFITNDDIVPSFLYSFIDQVVVFSDGTELHWDRDPIYNNTDLNKRKHPIFKKYWKIQNPKKNTYEAEYTIDEEDYQTALYLQTQDSLARLNR